MELLEDEADFFARTRFKSAAAIRQHCVSIEPDFAGAGRSRQPIRFTSVDFPEPEGPIMAIHSPAATVRLKPSRALMLLLPSARAGNSLLARFSRIMRFIHPSIIHPLAWLPAEMRRSRETGSMAEIRASTTLPASASGSTPSLG